MSTPMIEMHGIVKTYFEGKPNALEILHGIDLVVQPGEFVSIVGESGSGKSTLMNLIGALDRPSKAAIGWMVWMFPTPPTVSFRKFATEKIGFVFQNFNLIGRSNAQKNVELPLLYAGVPARERSRRAKELLELVGMGQRSRHKPAELSGGQKQRVAIARALACEAPLLLADEPTGALDTATSRTVMDLFHRLHKEQGKTIVLITHSPQLAAETERVITLMDGCIVGEEKGGAYHDG